MVRERIKIEKILSTPARQVTFSKRRRGLTKKAHELSILCDVDVALVVFSSTGKLSHFSNSRIEDIFERHNNHTGNNKKPNVPSQKYQVENSKYAQKRNQVEELDHKLRQMRGEELQGLTIEELQNIEKTMELGLHRVVKKKKEMMLKEIDGLQKVIQLMKENARLKLQIGPPYQVMELPKQGTKTTNQETYPLVNSGQCSESIATISVDSREILEFDDNSDTSLKLGLPFFN